MAIHSVYYQISTTWFFAVALIRIVALEKKASGDCKHCRHQKARQYFYQGCNCSWRSFSQTMAQRERLSVGILTELKPEQWICVLTIMTNTAMSPSCALLVHHAAKQVICGSNVSRVHFEQPCFPLRMKSSNNSQTVCWANVLLKTNTSHNRQYDQSSPDQIFLIKSSPHSYQGRDLPFR